MTARLLTSSSLQPSKKTKNKKKKKQHQPTFKSNFYLFVKTGTFTKFNLQC